MTQFSLANLFGITLRESANDGSDFTNPDADYRRLFLGEDGLLHLRDSAGTVTTPGVGAGAITSSGLTQATARLLGRTTASTGAIEEITVGSGLSLAAGALTATGGGATFTALGTTSDGGSDKTARGLYLKQVTTAGAGLITHIGGFFKGDASNVVSMIPLIYTNSSNLPVNLVTPVWPNITTAPTRVVASILNTTVRAMEAPVSYYVSGATTLWVGWWLTAGADSRIILRYASGAGATNYVDASAAQNEPVDISIAAGSTTSDNLSIYCRVLT